MDQIIKFQSSREHYKADLSLVWCFDHRFWNLREKFLKEKFPGKRIDLIDIAGGIKAISSPVHSWERDFAFLQIAKSIALHDPALFGFMDHEDCGDFGKKFENTADAKDYFSRELRKARELTQEYLGSDSLKEFLKSKDVVRVTNKPINLYYADFSGLEFIS